MSGRVVFIGAGPGAADLITLRGAARLAEADVVLFDALTDPALRAHAPQARWLDVGKRGFGCATGQATIDALLVRLARRHRVVVRLKGGDPCVFGRLEEELAALAAAGIASEVVPGVTAALAAAAHTQRPLTRRGRGRSEMCIRDRGWPAHTPVAVVSRAGCADAVASEHRLAELAAASVLHAGRPAVVTVGVGATAVAPAPQPGAVADAAQGRAPALAP